MSNIQEGDRIEYAPYHREKDPESARAKTTGEVTEVHEKPKNDDPEHKTYTILNDNTGKESTYGRRSITEVLDDATE